MFIVVSYDVVDDRRRVRLHKLLRGYGTWTQYSVFECNLTPPQLRELQGRVRGVVDAQVDQVRFYPLSADDVKRIAVVGEGKPAEDPRLYFFE